MAIEGQVMVGGDRHLNFYCDSCLSEAFFLKEGDDTVSSELKTCESPFWGGWAGVGRDVVEPVIF